MFDLDCAAGLRCVNQLCRIWVEEDAGQKSWLKRFGEPCDGGAKCESGLCVGGPGGAFCSQRCDGGCPGAYACKQVPDAGAACAVPQPLLCQACAGDLDCGASGADRCLAFSWQRFCGRDCTFAGCPALYTCAALDGGARQCVPQGRTCDCTADTLGLAKPCVAANDAGACWGAQVCGADGGFSPCTARTPAMETCNGVDDDCSGRVDELLPEACTRSNAAGTCTDLFICGDGGVVCPAREPAFETCNFKDDDCDGLRDEEFLDDAGRYAATPSHCGGCGNDCARLIAHATATACAVQAGLAGCRATACEAGWVVHDAGTCVQLADSLCRACVADSDCLGPGSRCVVSQGERFCGRDCGPGSAFPACPGGYSCAPQDGGGAQCTPQSGTCLCTTARIGTVRGCSFSTCRGYQQCAATGGGAAWSACDVASYNTEICDGIDDDCDGLVDEGFRNPVTLAYDSAQSCGFCNNDCTRIWSLSLQHTQGVCDATSPTPTCRMGPCATEVVGGVSYEWVNVNGAPADGCECRRVAGAALTDLPDRAPGATPQTSYVDENCDGVDGVLQDALFVWEKAAPLGNGSLASPFQTIGAALGALPASGKRYVLVAEGAYRENVLLFAGAQLFGGYAVDFRARDPRVHQSVIVGQAPSPLASGPSAAVHAQGIAAASPETVLAGFTVQGFDALQSPPDDAVGAPSYAVLLSDCGSGVVVSDNTILAGRGGAGGRGSTGDQGQGRQAGAAFDGLPGANAGRVSSGTCPSGFRRDGGSGGVNATCPGASALKGGDVVCPFVQFDGGLPDGGALPNEQEYPVADAGLNGRGGWDWSFHPLGGFGCNRASTHGQDHDGRDGLEGADGVPGAGGAGASAGARHGSVALGRWVAGPGATAGSLGTSGVAGGGGGAGGGTVRAPGASCTAWEWGATGGGGGAGACGGSGGRPGQPGGASIALFVSASGFTPAGSAPRVFGNRLARSFGGAGGNGGFGGFGGLGGRGGNGGAPTTWSNSTGGKGGEGGNGGMGGGGGGGAGGPSFGVFSFNVDVVPWAGQNTFLTAAGADTAGQGGVGGSSAGPGSTGGAGAAGASGDLVFLQACTPSCPGGTACDGNGVCVPL